MARINIEDSIYSDARFIDFVLQVGDQMTAIGSLVFAWRLAQTFWCPDQHLIPLVRWERLKHSQAMLDCGLAVLRDDSIYVCGTEEQFSWYFKKVAAGKRGGQARARNLREKSLAKPSKPKQIQPSSSSSSSSSEEEERIYTSDPKEISEGIQTWQKTLDRYGIDKKAKLDEIQIARLIQLHGFEKAKLALLGAGLETGSEQYNPARHCRITRLLKPDIFEKLVNLGAQHREPNRKIYDPDTGSAEAVPC